MADLLSPLLAYAAGALTILSPCVLPLVPIVLGSAAQAHPRGPLALAGGLVASFTLTGFLLATLGAASGFDGDWVRLAGAALLIAAGAALVIPAAQGLLSRAATPLADWANARKAGMERGDLLNVNGGIFKPQGQAINANAADDVRVLVVGNPCNTNCLIAKENAPDVPSDRWFAMTRLDQNRAETQLAQKAGAPVADVANLAIWGNHSATQFPDFANATIAGTPVPQAIGDQAWLEGPFIETVQKRGAAIIEARGASSAASAANAAIDTVVSLRTATPAGDCASVAVSSNGEYGVPEGLMFGYPIIADGSGSWSVAEGVEHDDFAKARIATTLNELIEERDAVKDLGLIG